MENYCEYQQRLMAGNSTETDDTQPIFITIFYPVLTLLGLKRFWQSTFYGLQLQVLQLRRQGQQLEALKVLIQGLTDCSFWRNHLRKWWNLMHLAVGIAQDLPFSPDKLSEPLQRLLKLCMEGPQPWQGYHVAYSFVSLSLWSFRLGKTHRALDQVNIAIHADPTWGYPEYLLGWYGLSLEGINPIPHFVRAIQANWFFLQRMKQDPLCQQFPDILQAVKQELLVKGIHS